MTTHDDTPDTPGAPGTPGGPTPAAPAPPPPAYPTGFSAHNPNLRTAWDSTTLNDLQFCPRYYQYTHLDGWTGPRTDFEFGGFAAEGFEVYNTARGRGVERDASILLALRHVLTITWNEKTGRPWGGDYEAMWRCTGVEKYRNNKGNVAKCPYAHKGAWFPQPAPGICGECGSGVEEAKQYVPNDDLKNREKLAEMIVWYGLEQPENLEDGLRPYRFPDGTVATELSYKVPLGFNNEYGEPYIIAGHFDTIKSFGTEEVFIVDQKTTKKPLTSHFWESYSPNTQFDTYDAVSVALFPDLPIAGVMIDAVQVLKTGVKFGRHVYYRDDAMREEHLTNIAYWIRVAAAMAEAGYWPQNKRNCWLCPFNGICSITPSERERFLRSNWQKRERWNPLIPRNTKGDPNGEQQ